MWGKSEPKGNKISHNVLSPYISKLSNQERLLHHIPNICNVPKMMLYILRLKKKKSKVTFCHYATVIFSKHWREVELSYIHNIAKKVKCFACQGSFF